jgi:serine/threonine-protein kinase PRP4
MTNLSSGFKRPWDGETYSHKKRPREEPRDWRDVHLKSPRRSSVSGWSSRRDNSGSRRDYDRGEHRRGSDFDRRRDEEREEGE